MERIYNFNPGPAALPLEVLQKAEREFVEYGNYGMSLMEMSHRSKAVEELIEETEQLFHELLGLTEGYRTLFMSGGASAQFALVPLNLLKAGKRGGYILSGSFSEKAYQEALAVGEAEVLASGKEHRWSRVPEIAGIRMDEDIAYVHMTTNNTIEGSQFYELPETGSTPLIGDMTSDILSRKLDWSRFAMFYAAAQKNLGPAGLTVAVIRDDLLKECNEHIPTIFRYGTYAKNHSLYNTPPVHSIYMMKLMLQWTQRQGGVAEMEERNARKAALLYDVIDASGEFYMGVVDRPYRSKMNVTWRMRDEELEKQFVREAECAGFVGLAGHRSVGGLRASAYNAVPVEACEALAQFMIDFKRKKG
jgi:phosphoserine aminotransferase